MNPSCAISVLEVLEAVVSNCAMQANDELMSEADEEVHAILKAANSAMGAAIRQLGPQAVLTILPLCIQVCVFTVFSDTHCHDLHSAHLYSL